MAAVTASRRRTAAEIHRDALADLCARRDALAALLADAPATLAQLRDAEIRDKPLGRTGAVGSKVAAHSRKVEEAKRELPNVEAEIASRARLLTEAQAAEEAAQAKTLRREAQRYSEREAEALDALVERVAGVLSAYAELVQVAEQKANALAGASISDAGVAEALREAFRPRLQPFPADAGAAFQLVYEAACDPETRAASLPVAEVGRALPDPLLDPLAYREALENQERDRAEGNVPRPAPIRARPIVRDRQAVAGLESIRDLTGLDVTPRDVLGATFSSKPTRGMAEVGPVVGPQFGGVGEAAAWPRPGEGG